MAKQTKKARQIQRQGKVAVHLSPEGHLLGVEKVGEGGSFVPSVIYRLDHRLPVGPSFVVQSAPGGFRLVPL